MPKGARRTGSYAARLTTPLTPRVAPDRRMNLARVRVEHANRPFVRRDQQPISVGPTHMKLRHRRRRFAKSEPKCCNLPLA
jgi:hypothetical protein